jgi:hypothetical protein
VVAEAGHGLVDAVVRDLVDEVMEASLVGATDVHTGSAAHGLQAFEDLNRTGVVLFLFDHAGRLLEDLALNRWGLLMVDADGVIYL